MALYSLIVLMSC